MECIKYENSFTQLLKCQMGEKDSRVSFGLKLNMSQQQVVAAKPNPTEQNKTIKKAVGWQSRIVVCSPQ
jgi:hypothetical protein